MEGSTSLRIVAQDLLCLVDLDDEFISGATLPRHWVAAKLIFHGLTLCT